MARNKAAPRPLSLLIVRRLPLRHNQGTLQAGARQLRCAIGRAGIAADKREGNGATPLATMRLLGGYHRGRPGPTGLRLQRIHEGLGWCDAPRDRNYNRPVALPYPASHETMARKDALYDVVIVLDWNMRPRIRNRGSAIFLHLARDGYLPTEGCVALSRRDMAWLLSRVSSATRLQVRL